MRRRGLRIRPHWHDSVFPYDYMSVLAKPDWAWECLRRNPVYRSIARLRLERGIIQVRLAAGPMLTRLYARSPHAEAWGLCCFR